MTSLTPKYNNWFSFGNILTIGFGAVTATAMFFVMDARSQQNSKDITEIKRQVDENEDEINDLKLNDVRLFEKLDNIFLGVTKIEAHLERQRGGN
jgi:hypothetical protein